MAWSKPAPEATSAYPKKAESEPPKKPGLLSRLASGARSVGKTISSGVKYIRPKVARGARAVGSGAKYAGKQAARGGVYVGREVKSEVKRVVRKKIRRGVRKILHESPSAQKSSPTASPRYDAYGNTIIRRQYGGRP